MDLGIRGKKALICGASQGLGRACADTLAEEGVNLVLLARTQATLEKAADEIRQRYGVEVLALPCDVTSVQGRHDAIAACEDPDILITNASGPPTGDFRNFSLNDWEKAVNANMLAPVELIRMTVSGMMERGFGRVVNITSWAVKMPTDAYALSAAPRLGLTGFSSNVARAVASHNVTVNSLLPGVYDTDRSKSLLAAHAQHLGLSVEQLEKDQVQTIPAKRFGDPSEFGAACAFLCSVYAGYITGQNLLMDGGRYPGIF
ncbi:SDR family oxidoreductase [Dyella caseinilytica]|uniref:SDR family oxidoreductase n=1 Tax=Dyella caseinilytica TaxID=1849581 RepID=A0ABX7H0D4_9GAMM|nr:SDR family oxidoreductase [Dyella caseinilytica]QRN55539.1 SDR family oxidoreductase [Dyella caseinilytica]GGA02526.1 dehydrogenase [Dyella caseinilytica]